MFSKFLKGLLTLGLLVVMGILSVMEIWLEVVYQIVRLIKRGFGYITGEFVKLIGSLYKGGFKIKVRRKEINETNEIRFYEFDYED